MVTLYKNISLKPFNTFGVEARAGVLAEFDSVDDLKSVQGYLENNAFVLGGGSNMLFTRDMDCVVKPCLLGTDVILGSENSVYVKAAASVNWDSFVDFCANRDFGGVENLSAIPGTVGASPIQNIGAYGSEIKDILVSVEYYDILARKIKTIAHEECGFGYRDSVFKNKLKGKAIVLSVTFRLTTENHSFKMEYPLVKETVEKLGGATIMNIRKAVVQIRKNKLPDPETTGNAGSFFRNPVIPAPQFDLLKKEFKDIPHYPDEKGNVKIPAAWLIEKAGWKGKEKGNVATHPLQPLVIINKTGKATGIEIMDFAATLVQDISKVFGIKLVREVNII